MGSPKYKSNSKPFTFGSPSKPRSGSKGHAGQSSGKSRTRSTSFGNHNLSVSTVSTVPAATAAAPDANDGSPVTPDSKKAGFSPQQQKTIIEHLLITKNSAPQKNYSHVPCKFFRQGACQAGNSCPFSHSLNVLAADQTPCKYFQKGNCKFGSKCANAHILPNGTRVNPPKNSFYGAINCSSAPSVDAPAPMPIPVINDTSALSSQQRLSDSTLVNMQQFHYKRNSLPPIHTSYLQNKDPSLISSFTPLSAQPADEFDGEEFVPSELSDLLTPTELKRRNSRPSSTRKLSFSDSGSAPSTSSTLTSSYSENIYPITSMGAHQRNPSVVSSTSTNYSPPTSHTPFLNTQQQYVFPSPNYTFQQEKQSVITRESYFQSPWNNETPVTPWNDYHASRVMGFLGEDLKKLKIHEEDEERSVSTVQEGSKDPIPVLSNSQSNDAGHQEMHFFFDDLHQGIY